MAATRETITGNQILEPAEARRRFNKFAWGRATGYMGLRRGRSLALLAKKRYFDDSPCMSSDCQKAVVVLATNGGKGHLEIGCAAGNQPLNFYEENPVGKLFRCADYTPKRRS
jgi:hypothetical protein